MKKHPSLEDYGYIENRTTGIAKRVTNMCGTPPKKVKAKKEVKKESKEKSFIEFALIANKIPYEKELQFAKPRKFRFDYVIPSLMIYIEYEGIMGAKSGHTTIQGYTSNTEKYNIAALMGYRGLRYTALNYKNIVEDLKSLKK